MKPIYVVLFLLWASSAIAESDLRENWLDNNLNWDQAGASLSQASRVKENNLSALAPRAAYREVPLPKDKKLVGADPRQIARSVFGNSESGEGNFQEEVVLIEKTDKRALVTLTQTGLPDDSVEGMRYRLEFIREGNQWRLNWAGRQVRCYAGRGKNAWTTGSCN